MIEQALEMAIRLHQAGRLAEAEENCRQILTRFPDHAPALHLLGVLACKAGDADAAIDLISRAITSDPAVVDYHCNLGAALGAAGRWDEAINGFKRATQLRPDYAEAHSNLGNALGNQGRFDEAIAACCRAIRLKPGLAEAHNNLGNALRHKGRLDEATTVYQWAIDLKPDYPEAYNNLGSVLQEKGRLDDAIVALGHAIELRPAFAEAHGSLGNALQEKGAFDEAIAAYRHAIGLRPDYAEAHSNLSNALRSKGRHDEAIAACARAIELDPDFADAYTNLGNVLKDVGRLGEAIAAYSRAIRLNPNQAQPCNNLGVALCETDRLDEAIALCTRAIELRPDYAEAHNNLGAILLAQGRLDLAIRAHERALELRPGYATAHSNVLMCEQYRTGVSLAGLAQAHAEWDERHAAPYRASGKPWDLDRDPDRPLRVGFVSPHLRRNPVGYFLARVLENLDRNACVVVCYHNSAVRDAMTDRLAAKASRWHDVAGLSDDELAAQIRADRIDILFDLAGHTANHRLLVFARRPAPIQISWMGYVGTTGLKGMDYLLADRFHVPPSAEVYYSEQVLRMPAGYVCYDPPPSAPAVGPLPAFDRGYVTFGSFNNVAKLTPEVLALWAEIVRRVPGSRLLLVTSALGGATARERIGSAFEAAGGDRDRLELRGSLAWPDLLAAYNTVDVALDPFPYSGGVTTCEALWMGVPVVTCPGETFAGRHSLSHLSNVGLTGTVAGDTREYADLAVRLAGDLSHLASLRAELRTRMGRSPLCDGELFAPQLTALLRNVWRQWCRR